MAEELALEAAVEAEPLETGAETLESTTSEETGAETTERPEQTSGEDVPAPQIYKAIKEALKAHDPNALRQVRKALHLMDEVKAKAPDGIGKLVERMELVNQLDDDDEDPEYQPGTRTFDEVIERTVAERTFWRDYDRSFQAGDPAIVNQMVEANPESFQKILPIALDKYAELNPEGFSSIICRSAAQYFESAQIPLQMEVLDMLLPRESNDPSTLRVIQAFQAIKKTINDIRGWAQKPVAPKVVTGGGSAPVTPANQNGNGVDAETKLRNYEWSNAVAPKSNNYAAQEAIRVFGEKKFNAGEVGQLQKAIKDEINARIAINPAYQRKIAGFLKANNKTAYTMAVESEHKRIISGAIKRLGDDILAKRSNGAAKPKPVVTAKPGVPTASQNGDERFDLVAGPPRTQGLEIDHRRMNQLGGGQGMKWLRENKAYVVGRKNPVKWR